MPKCNFNKAAKNTLRRCSYAFIAWLFSVHDKLIVKESSPGDYPFNIKILGSKEICRNKGCPKHLHKLLSILG